MDVTLRQVTRSNYDAVCELQIPEEQQNHLAPNVYSLVEAHYDAHETRAIYLEDELVGFIMWTFESDQKISICRFMIAYKYQRKGIGQMSLELAIDEIHAIVGIREIEICYGPTNEVAKCLYKKVGFRETGMNKNGDEILAIIDIDSRQ